MVYQKTGGTCPYQNLLPGLFFLSYFSQVGSYGGYNIGYNPGYNLYNMGYNIDK